MKPQQLTVDELALVNTPQERRILEEIKGMTIQELHAYDSCFKVTDQKHYVHHQKPWLEMERYLLGNNLGHDPNTTEFINDFNNRYIGVKHKVFYCKSHPEKTEWV